MGFKLRSSGLPFKQMGSSPAKQVPGYKPEELTENNQAWTNYTLPTAGSQEEKAQHTTEGKSDGRRFDKGLAEVRRNRRARGDEYGKPDKKSATNKSSNNSVSKGASEAVQGFVDGGKMALKQSMKKAAKPVEKKYMKVTKDLQMKPPYKNPVGPRAGSSPTPYASPAKQAKKKSNISSTKGSSVITNTNTGDTYDLKTGDTVKNRQPKGEPRKRKEPTKRPR